MWHDNDWQGWYHDDVSWKTAGDLVAPDAQCAHEAHDDVEKDKSVALTKSKRVKKNMPIDVNMLHMRKTH
jgi:hypothetical protein